MEFWYIIITYLNAWRFGYGIQQPRTSSYDFHIAAKAQNKLGWKNFLFDKLHVYSAMCIDKYYKSIKKRVSGTSFISRLIIQVCKISQAQWDDRNWCLHTIQKASEHQDSQDLTTKISHEYNEGHNNLPDYYIQFFT